MSGYQAGIVIGAICGVLFVFPLSWAVMGLCFGNKGRTRKSRRRKERIRGRGPILG